MSPKDLVPSDEDSGLPGPTFHLQSRDPRDQAQPTSDLLRRFKEAITLAFAGALHGGAKWVQGKGQQELAKAMEIVAAVEEKIGRYELDRQAQLHAQRQSEVEGEHRREIEKLEAVTKAFERLCDALARCKSAGVSVVMLRKLEKQILAFLDTGGASPAGRIQVLP